MAASTNRSRRGAGALARSLLMAGALLLSSGPASAQDPSSPAGAADAFLKTLAASAPDACWRTASPQFRAKLSSARWARYARASGLAHFRSATWTDLALKNGVAFLLGTVELQEGRIVPARFELVKVGARWRILFVDLKLSGAAYKAVRQPGVATDVH